MVPDIVDKKNDRLNVREGVSFDNTDFFRVCSVNVTTKQQQATAATKNMSNIHI